MASTVYPHQFPHQRPATDRAGEDSVSLCKKRAYEFSGGVWQAPRALVVDARPARAELIQAMLETQGIETTWVADATGLVAGRIDPENAASNDDEAPRFDLVVSEYRLEGSGAARRFLHLLRCADDPLGPAERSELVEMPFAIEDLIAALGRVLAEGLDDVDGGRNGLPSPVWMKGFEAATPCPEPTVDVGSAAETRTVRALTRRSPT